MKLTQHTIDLELTPQEAVVAIMSAQIFACLRTAASQQYFPSADADMMDSTISGNKKRAADLRKLREDYENLTSNVLMDDPRV